MSTAPTPDRPVFRCGPRGLRILIVEDHVDCAESLQLLLTLCGHDVRWARDGPTALDVAAGFDPDVVLLDLGLPGMGGYEVATRLTADRLFTQTPLVVVVSGYAEDRARSATCGIDLHLVKPVVFADLEAVLDRFRALLDGLTEPADGVPAEAAYSMSG